MRQLILFPAALLSAAQVAAEPPGFGDSVRANMAAHIVNPNPQYEGTEIEGGDGKRASDAVERYRNGRIKEPRGLTASGAQIEQSGGSGASTGGASGGGAPKGP